MHDRPSPLLPAAIRLARILAWLIVGACLPAAAQGLPDEPRDAIVGRAWLDDPDSALSPQEALERPWIPFSGPLGRGYTASTTWVRLRIDPAAAAPGSADADRRLVLRIVPGHLDEVAVFRVDRLSEPPVLVGDTHPVAGPQQGLLHYAVVIDDAAAPFEMLLRLRTQSNHSLHAQVLRWDDARVASIKQHSLVIGYLVFTVMVIAWAMLAWLEHRNTVIALFIAHQGSALLAAVTVLGVLRFYGPEWLEPSLDRLTSMAIPLSAIATMLFHARLLADLGCGRTESMLLKATVALPIIGLVQVALGEVRPGLILTQATVPLLLALLLVTAWRVRPAPASADGKGGAGRRVYLVTVYALMALIMLPQSLRVLGLFPAPPWSYGGFYAYGVASALLLGSLLVYHGREARRRRREADAAFAQARREADTQRARASEQAELMTMLTHELKTPLTVVSLALGKAGRQATLRERALRAVGNMRSVIDRCAQVALVDDMSVRHDASPKLAPVRMDEVLAEAVAAQLQADRVDCRVSPGLPACLADRQMLLVIVSNLVENALKYSPPEGRVQASLEAAAHGNRPGLALQVANRVGMAGRPDAAHAFDKYHRGSRARHRSGSGLGLYLSQRLADRLGAELSLLDAAGDAGEVRFELWVPC